MFDNPNLSGQAVFEVRPKDIVLLLKHQVSSGKILGYVMSTGVQRVAGWLSLEALKQQRLDGSWQMRARYRVQYPATLRSDASLSSSIVAEVSPGQEVLTLEIGVHVNSDATGPRLRLKVSACPTDSPVGRDEELVVGWMSAETAGGDKLLDPVNLLGMDALKVHRHSVLNNKPEAGAMRRLSSRSNNGEASVDNPLNSIPWQVGGQYRVLEVLPIREGIYLSSKKLGQLPAGAMLTVSEIHMVECPHLGWCPCAYVSATSDTKQLKLQAQKGWVRCAGKDGRNLIDERDQLEFEKVHARLQAATATERDRKVSISPHPPQQLEIAGRLDQYPDDDDSDFTDDSQAEYYESEEEESSHDGDWKDSAQKLPAALSASRDKGLEPGDAQSKAKELDFAKRLEAMEIGTREDKMVDDKTIITDERFCGCNACGATAAK